MKTTILNNLVQSYDEFSRDAITSSCHCQQVKRYWYFCTEALQGAHSRAYSTAWECVRVIGMIRLVKSLGTSWTEECKFQIKRIFQSYEREISLLS